jgi:hypothetical protein
MKTSISLRTILERNDWSVCEYSGRGMFGQTCLGVTVDDPVCFLWQLHFDIQDTLDEDEELKLEAGFKSVKWDQMGHDFIVYWPYISYEDKE